MFIVSIEIINEEQTFRISDALATQIVDNFYKYNPSLDVSDTCIGISLTIAEDSYDIVLDKIKDIIKTDPISEDSLIDINLTFYSKKG